MVNNYTNYYAQQQQQQKQNYSAQQPSYSVPAPTTTAYQAATASAAGNSQWLNRYGYSQQQNTSSYATSNPSNDWYSGNTSSVNTLNNNREDQSKRSDIHNQYSYRTNYDSSALGSLAYASSLNLENAARSTSNAQADQQMYSQQAQQSVSAQQPHSAPQHNHEPEMNSTHTAYGHQQQRPGSVNSVGSAHSNPRAHPMQRPASNNMRYSQSPVVQQTQQQQIPQTAQHMNQGQTSTSSTTTMHRWNPANYRPQQQSQDQHQQTSGYTFPNASRTQGMNQVFTRHEPRASNESLPMTNQNQTPIEPPTPTTVDPSQVYDPYLDYQRQAAKRAAEEEAAKKAEEERRKVEETPNAAKEQPPTLEEAQPARKGTAKSSGSRKERKSDTGTTGSTKKRNSKAKQASDTDASAETAARTLMQTAGGDLETQMREMFKRMREFNEKDPDLLSKLWQQERDEHIARLSQSQSSPTSAPATASSSRGEKSKKATPKKTATPTATKNNSEPTQPVQTGHQPQAEPRTAPQQSSRAAVSTTVQGNPPTTQQQQRPSMPPSQQIPPLPESLRKPAPAPAPTAPLASSPVQPTSGTMWPADKKSTLAGAAANLLRDYPANRGRTITASQIAALLDTNPSYLELCKKIESIGFYVDRPNFARGLLAAVPDVTRSQKLAQAAHNTQQTSSNGTTNTATSEEQKLKEAQAKLMDTTSMLDTESKKERPAKPRTSLPKQKSAEGEANVKVDVPDSVIDPQLEGLDAVKRFVDEGPTLATNSHQTDSKVSRQKNSAKNRAPEPPNPVLKEDQARKRTFSDLVDLTLLSDEEEASGPPPKRLETQFDTTINSQLPTPPDTTGSDLQPAKPGPTEAKLPAKTKWDHLRPGAQIPTNTSSGESFQAPIPINHPVRSAPVAMPLDKYKAIRRSTYDPRTIARDVLLACGRHPDMRHLNAHYDTIRHAFPQLDNLVDLDTLRWDLIDPGGPPVGSGSQQTQSRVDDEPVFVDDDTDEADDEDDHAGSSALTAPQTVRQVVGVEDGSSTTRPQVPHQLHTYKLDKPKIKGPPRKSDPGIRKHADGDETHRRGPGRPRISEGANVSKESPKPMTYAALRAAQSGSNGTAPRRKGRPVGWRKWMQKVGGGTPAKSAGSKPKPPSPEPVYQVYKCEWEGCHAELHNLKTLRKHIVKVHGKQDEKDGLFWCLWQDCGKVQSITDKQTQRTKSRWQHLSFATAEDWKTHVEKVHLTPIAWKLGDGPVGGLSDAQDSGSASEAYMSDRQGRRVTPQVTISEDQEAEARSIAPGKRIPKKTPEEQAKEVQRQVERQKQAIGVGVDRGGARLANDKRRMGFVDDEDVAEVISDADE